MITFKSFFLYLQHYFTSFVTHLTPSAELNSDFLLFIWDGHQRPLTTSEAVAKEDQLIIRPQGFGSTHAGRRCDDVASYLLA